MLCNVVPSGPIGQGRHAPIGTADSTAMGTTSRPGSYWVTSPNWLGAWVPSSNWPTDQLQGTKPVRGRVRPATEGTQPHHRRETFLYTLKAGLGRVPWSGGNEGVVVNLSDDARAGR